MKIGLYGKEHGRQRMYVRCALEALGHEVHESDNAEDFYDDDVTILMLYYLLGSMIDKDIEHTLMKEAVKIKGKSKCVLVYQAEHIFVSFGRIHARGLTFWKDIYDGVLNVFPEIQKQTEELLEDKKVYLLPHAGYHEKMTTFGNSDLVCPADVLMLDGTWGTHRHKFRRALNWIEEKVFVGPEWDMNKIGAYVKTAKVCLTVSSLECGSISPLRVVHMFLANNGFVLCEKPGGETSYLVDGEHLVYFDGVDDMMDKITYFSKNQDEARAIADKGFEHVRNNLKMTDMFIPILKDIEDQFLI
jgi:hypothetical protein